jgi:hypothetical protein
VCKAVRKREAPRGELARRENQRRDGQGDPRGPRPGKEAPVRQDELSEQNVYIGVRLSPHFR